MDPSLKVQVFNSVTEIGQNEWDTLSNGQPFQSYRWYVYGEKTMADSLPVYIIVIRGTKVVGRAAFWLVREEPLPVHPTTRRILQQVLRRWPPLICRSPHCGLSGLILPEPPYCEAALQAILTASQQEIHRLGGSFLIFDYLEPDQASWSIWPKGFKAITVADPGSKLVLHWDSFEDFISSSNWRIRQHYKRSRRSAADLGIQITRHKKAGSIDMALELIRNIERRHASAPDPWARGMIEQMKLVDGTWLEAHIGDRLVGCLLLLEDGKVQIARLPGLADDVPYVYFMLLYEAIQEAFENKIRTLRWGSGAYETKQRLGFELEYNNEIIIWGRGVVPKLIAALF